MESDARNGVEYWLSIHINMEEALYRLRDWNHLKIAYEETTVWIRGFAQAEIESNKVLSLSSISRYYLQNTKLYFIGKRLPHCIEPNLLWTPIQRGLTVGLPKQNFNYFELKAKHHLTIVPSNKEKVVNATIVNTKVLLDYMFDAPSVRTKHLHWTIIKNRSALILGSPILPIQGEDYYQTGCFIIKAGWKLKFENMIKIYEQALPETNTYWYLLDQQNKICRINKMDFSSLSKGSILKTLELISNKSNLQSNS